MSLETILIIVLIVFLLGRRRLVAVNATFWNKIADRVIDVELILGASSGVPNAIFVRG
jgi:hypothetical protein